METIAVDALLDEPARDGVLPGRQGQGVVKGGVETGHLGQVRIQLAQGMDGAEVVRLMQRRQWNQGAELFYHRLIDQYRLLELLAAVHHPVADGNEALPGGLLFQRGQYQLQGLAMVGGGDGLLLLLAVAPWNAADQGDSRAR